MESEGDASLSTAARNSIGRNLRTVGLATLLSRLLGLVRDIAMASLFGAGTVLDVFIVAFRLPNLTRQLFGEGALTTAFLPVFVKDQHQYGDQAARATLTAVAIVLASTLSIIVLLGEACIAWGLLSLELTSSTRLLFQLLAILLPYMIFICTAALLSATLHAMRIFLWPALVPVVLNIIWLTSTLVAVLSTPDEILRVRIVSCSITFAGMCQFLLPLIVLHRLGMGFTADWKRGWKRVFEVVRTMLPVVAGITVMQLNVVLDSIMAWGLSRPDGGGIAPFEAWGLPALLSSGTATELYIGQRMYQFPLGVFGIALGTVLYPLLTRHAQAGDLPALRDELSRGIRLTIVIALPASVGLFLLAEPLSNFLFRHGKFSSDDSTMTARMIATYGGGVWAYIGLTILNRAFYATDDRITPMRFGIVALILNIVLNVILIFPLRGIGLALGSVLATAIQLGLTVSQLNHQVGRLNWQEIGTTCWKAVLASFIMGVACFLTRAAIPDQYGMTSYSAELVLTFLAGIVSYYLCSKLLRMTEIDQVLRKEDSQPGS